MSVIGEVETPASRILYINSKDATTRYGNFDTNFDFQLEEPITVDPHHLILLSLYSAEVPFSFYYFDTGQNTRLVFQLTAYGTCASYMNFGSFNETLAQSKVIYIPEGNYNAVELAKQLTDQLGDTTANPGVFPAKIEFNPITLKFDFIITTPGYRMTIGISSVSNIFGAGTIGGNMNAELGFVYQHRLPADDGDIYFGYDGVNYESGYSSANPSGFPGPVPAPFIPGPGVDRATAPPEAPIIAENVCDITSSIRSLFLRTNLSTNSVLDSHIGGGFSNILSRIPINAESGGTIRIEPVNGDIHKLLIKTKSITSVSLRLTNQENIDVDLNGLHFDVSLKMDFIHERDLQVRPEFREIWDKTQDEIREQLGETAQRIEEQKIQVNPRPDRIPQDTKKKSEEKPDKK